MASKLLKSETGLIVDDRALVRRAALVVDARLQQAARAVIAMWDGIQRDQGYRDDAVCAYLSLRYLRGYRVAEIARITGVSVSTLYRSYGVAARVQLHRHLRMIDAAYAERWYSGRCVEQALAPIAARQAPPRRRTGTRQGHLRLVGSSAPAAASPSSPSSPSVA